MHDLRKINAMNAARTTGWLQARKGMTLHEAQEFQHGYPKGIIRSEYMRGYRSGQVNVPLKTAHAYLTDSETLLKGVTVSNNNSPQQ